MRGGLMRLGVGAFTVTLLAAAAPARAQSREVEQLLGECVESYRDADLLNALQKCKVIVEMQDVQDKALAEAYKYLAASQFQVGDKSTVVLSFTRALELNPELILSGEEFHPELVRMFDKLRNTHVTDLEIISRPTMTPVFVNGLPVGETPFIQRNIFKKTYQVRLERPRYDPVSIQIDLRAQNHYAFNLLESCGVRDIVIRGMKGEKVLDRVMEHADALALTISYSGCRFDRDRVRQMLFRDLGSGTIQEVIPVHLPEESGVVEVVFRTPPQGWQPGRFEFRILSIDAAEEEEGASVQFAVER